MNEISHCPNCGIGVEEGVKFCRNCGMPLLVTGEDVNTLRLPPQTQKAPESARPTIPVSPPSTAPNQTFPQMYERPDQPYPAPKPEFYAPPSAPAMGPAKISLGDWLSGGWQVYKEYWLLMSLATLLGALLGSVTFGVLAGPLLMGLYRMAFKTMRGERPEMGDLFMWQGRFLQAFLLGLIVSLVYGGVAGIGRGSPLSAILSFVTVPFLTVILGLGMPFILERKADVLAAINEVGRMVFSRDALTWWIVGIVFAALAPLGILGCLVGAFVTFPWIVSSAAVAYRDVYGLDDPNRTLH